MNAQTRKFVLRWRLIALLVAVAVSVVLPYAVNRSTTESALVARDWVAHTARVKAAVYHLDFTLRDMEAACYSILQGATDPAFRKRFDDDRKSVPRLLEQLRALTRDNPGEQARMGSFAVLVDGRMAMMRQALSRYHDGNVNDAYQALADAMKLFKYAPLADRILTEEARLLDQRTAVANHRARQLHWMTLATAIAQLVLLGMVVVVSERQIQQRWRAEDRTREAVQRAQLVLQSVREPIAVLDARLNTIAVNAAFTELYGAGTTVDRSVPLEELGDQTWNDKALLQRLRDVIARDRELWDYELQQTTRDGVPRYVLINARQLSLPDRDEPALLLTVSDVSALKMAEQQVIELNRQLKGKVAQVSDVNRELEAFSYSVSHDLRAPLRHVAGFSDKLGKHLGDRADDKTRHYMATIIDASRRMSQLIDDLLVYSRLGRGALRMQPVDMQSLVDEARSLVTADDEERDIQWRISQLPVVEGDENMLRTVWQNLLGNAVKYTGKREQAVIEVSCERAANGDYVFAVKDNGAGFDMRFVDKLFGVFQRLHKASDFSGSGIGLANVRRIITRHGGRTWAEGELDKGASFFFSLPASVTTDDHSRG